MRVQTSISRVVVALILGVGPEAPIVSAQIPADRRVGNDAFGHEVVVKTVNPFHIGALSVATGVPIGMESLDPVTPPPPAPDDLVLTGRRIDEALDEWLARDDRYQWRAIDGVIVIRPRAAWDDPGNVLNTPIGATKLERAFAADVLNLAADLLGGPRNGPESFPDNKAFSLDVPAGTILDLLNASVRSHGELSWVITPAGSVGDGRPLFPYTIHLWVGGMGKGLGVSGLTRSAPLIPAAAAVDTQMPSILDRQVKARPDGQLLVAHSVSDYGIEALADAAGVPMGIERLEPLDVPQSVREVTITGLSLRAALDTLIGLDSRYAWQEMNGVIVVRPVTAWGNPTHPLFRPVGSIQLTNVKPKRGIDAVASLLGVPEPNTSFPDSKDISLDLPPGTILDLLNGIARAHGRLVWSFSRLSEEDRRLTGFRHSLTFLTRGGGHGMAVP